jgi:predicted  nucleic acid-binding Zn-ribbon protein
LREVIKPLMEIQTLDRKTRELEESLSTVAGRVNQLREDIGKYQAELEKLSAEDQTTALARKKLEREIAEGDARLRNKRMRQNLVRNEKEQMALGHEVDTLKETNQRLEAELLAVMEGAEPRAARMKELSELIEKSKADLSAGEKEIAGEVEQIKSEVARNRHERDKLAKEIERPLLQRYEMIFARRGGVAVAIARNGTCQGCMRMIPPQLYNEIQKHLQIHFCPSCQRILYYEG